MGKGMADNWPHIGQLFTSPWPEYNHISAKKTPKCGSAMGQPFVDHWPTIGQPLSSHWPAMGGGGGDDDDDDDDDD